MPIILTTVVLLLKLGISQSFACYDEESLLQSKLFGFYKSFRRRDHTTVDSKRARTISLGGVTSSSLVAALFSE